MPPRPGDPASVRVQVHGTNVGSTLHEEAGVAKIGTGKVRRQQAAALLPWALGNSLCHPGQSMLEPGAGVPLGTGGERTDWHGLGEYLWSYIPGE